MPLDASKDEKRPIPKFASFRPKDPARSQEVDAQPTDINILPKSSLHEQHKRDNHRHRSRHEHRARTQGENEARDNSQGSFVVDRTGDPNNLTFGALHRYGTPSYFRFGAGNVVGSPREYKIDRSVSNEKGLILSNRLYDLPTKSDRRSIWKDNNREVLQELRIKPQANQAPDIDTADFVALSANQRIKRRRGNDGSSLDVSSSSGDDETHYRSIEGKARSNKKPADQDLIYNDNDVSSDEHEQSRSSTLDESVQRRRIELSRRVDADPTNCDAWLDLINHQDQIMGMNSSKRMGLTNAEKRSNADVKLSIYEKALDKVSNAEARETLLLGMMEEAIKVWPVERLSSQWESILKDNPGSLTLWTRFLDFKQTAFTSFRYDEVQSVYLNCLSTLERAQQMTGKAIAETEKIHEIQVYVVLRMTSFMRESGFSELATAAWQALLEYEFFKPTRLQGHEHKQGGPLHETVMSMFEAFWDSEVPRLGEGSSKGWASFCQKQADPPQPRTEVTDVLEGGQNIWKSWIASERRQGVLARKPARTIDEVEENDPYSVILFSDIRPFLIDSPSKTSREVLLDAFLIFCGLPPCQTESNDAPSRNWTGNGFLRNEALSQPNGPSPLWRLEAPKQRKPISEGSNPQADLLDDNSLSKDPFGFPLPSWRLSSGFLFTATGSWFSPFDAWRCSVNRGPLDMSWVIQALRTLVLSGIGGDSLAEFLLALELYLSPNTVKKTSRTLLKKQSANLRLYNAYALVEYRLGNPSKGENVIITSINMGKTLEASQEESLILWRTWIWEMMSAGNTQDALQRLMEFANEEVQTAPVKTNQLEDQGTKPALLLRTEMALTATRDHMLSLNKYRHASLAMECLFLFSYLRSSLLLAISTFKSNLALLSTNSANEHLHQSFAQLLYHHTTHTHSFKPADVRSLLAESIAQFPQNTIFLSLYAWNEARFRIDDRVRSIVNNVVLSNNASTSTPRGKQQESVTSHFFAIYTELHRGPTFGSNSSTIRSTFERAVESESGANCAGLWKLYFLFEHSRRENRRAKAVFWRGVRACPWVKELHLLAFEYLRDVLEDSELRGIYELMEEKGLRVHVGLEDES